MSADNVLSWIMAVFGPQNFTFALEASLLGQIFIFRTISQPQTLSADIPAARRGLFTNNYMAKLCERVRWTKYGAVIGYARGQDGAILPARDCPFCSRNNILLKAKRVQNIFCDSKKILCDFFVGMELENASSVLHVTTILDKTRWENVTR